MKRKVSIKDQKGFTLVELLIIIAIIGILASVVLVASTTSVSKARDEKRVAEINAVANALETYATNERNGYYPTYPELQSGCSVTMIEDADGNANAFICLVEFLKNKKYITNKYPKDPINNTTYRYEFEMDARNMCDSSDAAPYPVPSPCGYVDYRLRATLENNLIGSKLTSNAEGDFNEVGTGGCMLNNKFYCVGGDPATAFVPGKPVIYLYPEKTEKVAVNIYPKAVTNSIPAYDKGWNVIANPDGKLLNLSDNKEYPYLFWDGRSEKPMINRNAGFVIKSEDAETFLSDKLKQQGLNQKEADEFIEFWAPKMKSKAYVHVYFMPQVDYDKLVPMAIEPKPDTIIRVYMLFKSLDEPITVQEQSLSAPERKGFTAVEWGGDLSEIK